MVQELVIRMSGGVLYKHLFSTAMVSFTSVHRWNSLICPPLGFAFNFALLWLILHRTPKEMRVHSRILLQTCAMDTLLLVFQSIAQIVFTIDKRHAIFVMFYDGYFIQQLRTLQNPLFLFNLHSIWEILHILSVVGVAIQFIYRYLVLNRNIKVTWRQYLLLFLGSALYIAGMHLLVYVGLIDTLNRHPIDRRSYGHFVDFEQQQPLFVTVKIEYIISGGNHLFLIGLGGLIVLFALAYSSICFCGWKMVRFVNKNITLNGKLKELNRQLTRCLIILACLPLCMCTASFALCYDILFGNTTIPHESISADWTLEWELYLVLTFHWLPVLNPLVSICINRPYRDALLGRFIKITPITNG